MNKKSIRSILSVILVLSLLFVSSFEACALGKNANFDQKKELQELKANFNIEKKLKKVTGKKNVPKGLIKKVQNDIENLESVGWTLDFLDLDRIESNGDIVYSMEFPNWETNYITVDEKEGDLILDFYESDIHNTFVFEEDGSLIFDGHKVEFGDADKVISDRGMEANLRYTEYSLTSMTSSAYKSKSATAYAFKHVDIFEGLLDIALGSLITFLSWNIENKFAAVVNGGVSAYLTNAATGILKNAYKYGYNGKVISFKIYRYDSVNSTNTQRYSKIYGYYYCNGNYKGKQCTHTFYVRNYYA